MSVCPYVRPSRLLFNTCVGLFESSLVDIGVDDATRIVFEALNRRYVTSVNILLICRVILLLI